MSNVVESIFSAELTQQGLAELRNRYPATMVVDMSDEKQFKEARKTRTECKKLTDAINRRRIDSAKQVKEYADGLIDEVNGIYAVVVKPFEEEDKRRKEEAERIKREKEEALAAERAQINQMSAFVNECFGRDSGYIAGVLESVDLIETDCFSPDLIHEAIEKKKAVIAQLGQMLSDTKAREKMQEQQAELDRQRAEMERQRKELEELKAQAEEKVVERDTLHGMSTRTTVAHQENPVVVDKPEEAALELKAAAALHEITGVSVAECIEVVETIAAGKIPGIKAEF